MMTKKPRCSKKSNSPCWWNRTSYPSKMANESCQKAEKQLSKHSIFLHNTQPNNHSSCFRWSNHLSNIQRRRYHIHKPIIKRKDLNRLTINTLATSSLFDLDTALLNPVTDDYTTADTYALDRLNTKLEHLLKQQRKLGKKFLTDNDIDQIIDTILKKYV